MHIKIRYCIVLLLFVSMWSCDGENSSDSAQGTGGSLTRFAISQDYLYLATSSKLSVYDISQNKFEKGFEEFLGGEVETIQVNGEYLYMGAPDGMYIYSLTNRARPQFVFKYAHIVSCDPVVVQGNRAYVTLKAGTVCGGGVNSLEILDISNPNQPTLLAQYAMTSPGGLGVSGTCVFVCEGVHGLKMLSVGGDKVLPINEIADINAYDVIVQPEKLTLTGEDGVFQYGYDCTAGTLQLISKIPVSRVER